MALKQVTLLWGTNFRKRMLLNYPDSGTVRYYAKANDLLVAPEQDVILSDTVYSSPVDVRSKLKERTFSILVDVREGNQVTDGVDTGFVYDKVWQARLHELKKVLMSGPVRILVERAGIGNVHITCRYEGMTQVDGALFDIRFTAADPLFTGARVDILSTIAGTGATGTVPGAAPAAGEPDDPPASEWMVDYALHEVFTGRPNKSDANAQYSGASFTYTGSAPVDPTIALIVGGSGRVWRYRREFEVTNQMSSNTLQNIPVCLYLGDITVGSFNGKCNSDLGDIRIETFGGARKNIYIRRSDDAAGTIPNQTSGVYVRVWFTINSLQPKEAKRFRFLYNNPGAVIESEANYASVKPMFNMFTSANDTWKYTNFAPRYDQPQSRAAQWGPHSPAAGNITWISHPHSDFAVTDPLLVPCAGGRAVYHGKAAGYAGLQLITQIGVSSITYDWRSRSTYKTPFITRWYINGNWYDGFLDQSNTGLRTFPEGAVTGPTNTVACKTNGALLYTLGWRASDPIRFMLDNGTVVNTTIQTVDTPNGTMVLNNVAGNPAIPAGRSIDGATSMYQNPTGKAFAARTDTFDTTGGFAARGIMFGLRGDYPTLDIGEWTYGAVENCTVNLDATEMLSVLWRTGSATGSFDNATFSSAFEIDQDAALAANGYQIVGTIRNGADGKGIYVNTVMSGYRDMLLIDCSTRRSCLYYKWDIATAKYLEAEDRYECLTFEEVRDYWIRIWPDQDVNSVQLVNDPQYNFANLGMRVRYATRYY